jgi:hypothetical protein
LRKEVGGVMSYVFFSGQKVLFLTMIWFKIWMEVPSFYFIFLVWSTLFSISLMFWSSYFTSDTPISFCISSMNFFSKLMIVVYSLSLLKSTSSSNLEAINF